MRKRFLIQGDDARVRERLLKTERRCVRSRRGLRRGADMRDEGRILKTGGGEK